MIAKELKPVLEDSIEFSVEQHFDVLQEAVLKKISAKKIENLHNMAYVYYQNKYYEDADAFFRLLTKLKPENIHYWKGLGACLQMKKNYQDALLCYHHAQNILGESPDAYLYVHIADCHFAMKQSEQGFEILTLAKKRAVNDKKIIHHIAFMHERWKKKKKLTANH